MKKYILLHLNSNTCTCIQKNILDIRIARSMHFFKVHYMQMFLKRNMIYNKMHKIPKVSHPLLLPITKNKGNFKMFHNVIQGNSIIYLEPPNPILYLPKTVKKQQIAGLMSLDNDMRSYLTKSDAISTEIRSYILMYFSKVIFINTHFKTVDELFNNIITNIFDDIMPDSKLSPEVYSFFKNKKAITLTQHLTAFFWHNTFINYSILEKLCSQNHIDCKGFKDTKINIQTFLETSILKAVFSLSPSKDRPYIKIHLVNPENLPLNFDINESKERTHQIHADVLIETYDVTGKLLYKLYFDIKTYTVNTVNNKCNLSVLHADNYFLLREINNIFVGLESYKKKLSVVPKDFIRLMKQLQKIRSNEPNIKTRFEKIWLVLAETTNDFKYKDLKISLASIKEKDLLFISFYQTNLKYLIDKEKHNTEKIEKLFPKDYVIEEKQHQEIISYYIENLFPSEMQAEIKENFFKMVYPTKQITNF